MQKIGFLGAGRAAQILLTRFCSDPAWPRETTSFWTRSEATAQAILTRFPGLCQATVREVLAQSDMVFLSIPCNHLLSFLRIHVPDIRPNQILLSISVRVSYSELQTLVPSATVVRMLHSLPCEVGDGDISCYAGERSDEQLWDNLNLLLSRFGRIHRFIDEGAFLRTCPALCAPAILLKTLDMIQGAIGDLGDGGDTTKGILRASASGLGTWMRDTGHSYAEGIEMVATPGGLTESVLRAMNQDSGLAQGLECQTAMVREVIADVRLLL